MIKAGRHTLVPDDIKCYKDVDLSFGNFCSIASGLKIVSGQHPPIEHPACVTQFPFKETWDEDYYPSKMGGFVKVGHDIWIGEDVTLLEGITIGDGSIIGAKTVVASDVPAYTIAIGNPWEAIRQRFTYDIITALQKIAWWNWDDDKIKKAVPDMKNVNLFIEKYG